MTIRNERKELIENVGTNDLKNSETQFLRNLETSTAQTDQILIRIDLHQL